MRSTDGGQVWSYAVTVGPDDTSFLDTGGDLAAGQLSENTAYTYRYRIVGPGIPAVYSASFTATTALRPPINVTVAPDTSSTGGGTGGSVGGAFVSWTDVSVKESGYRVESRDTRVGNPSAAQGWTTVATVGANVDHVHIDTDPNGYTDSSGVRHIPQFRVVSIATGETAEGPTAEFFTATDLQAFTTPSTANVAGVTLAKFWSPNGVGHDFSTYKLTYGNLPDHVTVTFSRAGISRSPANIDHTLKFQGDGVGLTTPGSADPKSGAGLPDGVDDSQSIPRA